MECRHIVWCGSPAQGNLFCLSLVYGHPVGQIHLAIYDAAPFSSRYRECWPQSWGRTVPASRSGAALLARFDEWLAASKLHVRMLAELDDYETLPAFAAAGHGLVLLPPRLAAEVLACLPLVP